MNPIDYWLATFRYDCDCCTASALPRLLRGLKESSPEDFRRWMLSSDPTLFVNFCSYRSGKNADRLSEFVRLFLSLVSDRDSAKDRLVANWRPWFPKMPEVAELTFEIERATGSVRSDFVRFALGKKVADPVALLDMIRGYSEEERPASESETPRLRPACNTYHASVLKAFGDALESLDSGVCLHHASVGLVMASQPVDVAVQCHQNFAGMAAPVLARGLIGLSKQLASDTRSVGSTEDLANRLSALYLDALQWALSKEPRNIRDLSDDLDVSLESALGHLLEVAIAGGDASGRQRAKSVRQLLMGPCRGAFTQ